jgi:photosystem II stability/assembly factor-like uncharacterized protein
LYVAGKADVATSADGGATWTVIDAGLPGASITSLGLNALNEPVVGVGRSPAVGVYRYTGGSWHEAAGVSATLQISAFTLDSTGALIAVTAWGGDVFRSTDNGSTFTRVATNIGPNGALWTVATAPDGSLWAGGEPASGVLRSTDNGSTWQSAGLSTAAGYKGNIYAIGFNGAGEPLVGRSGNAGATDLQRDSGGTWSSASNGLPGYQIVTSLVTNAKGVVFACVPDSSVAGAGVYRSTDGGQSWATYSDGLPSGSGVSQLMLDQSGFLYAIDHSTGGDGGILYKTTAVP